jgi:CRP-like cAMP-binding protein
LGLQGVLGSPCFGEELSQTMFNEIFDQLAIFEGMDNTQRALLQSYFIVCGCAADEIIFRQGDHAEYLYVVIEGEVAVRFKPDDAPELVVSRIKEGEVFGWSAAFGRGTYTSGATCTKPSKFLRVRGSHLKMLRENHPETGILILERLAVIVAKRIENSEDHSQVVAFLEHGLKNGVKPIGG